MLQFMDNKTGAFLHRFYFVTTGMVILFKIGTFTHAIFIVKYVQKLQKEGFNMNISQNTNLKKLILTALFAALACVATMAIRIPTPGTGGYIHPGDAIVILSGVILGPGWGFLAAGIGSALADLMGGYFVYVPITFAIKGLVALCSGMIYRKMGKTSHLHYMAVALGGIADIILVAGGYFVCDIPLYGAAASAMSIPANLIQGVSGLVIALILYPVLIAIPDVRYISEKA